MAVTRARRGRQEAFNVEHGITPRTIVKAVRDLPTAPAEDDPQGWHPGRVLSDLVAESAELPRTEADARARIAALRKEMFEAAKDLEFEKAAELRDEILRLERLALEL